MRDRIGLFIRNTIGPATVLAQAAVHECREHLAAFEVRARPGLTELQGEGMEAIYRADQGRMQEKYTAILMRKRGFDAASRWSSLLGSELVPCAPRAGHPSRLAQKVVDYH